MSTNASMNAAQIAALTQLFDHACIDAVQKGRPLGYDPTIYLRMRAQHGPIDAAVKLIDGEVHYGVDRLWGLHRLDLTIEAIIYDNPQFQALFPADTVSNCAVLLSKVGYI